MTPAKQFIQAGVSLIRDLRLGSPKVSELRAGTASIKPYISGTPRIEIRK